MMNNKEIIAIADDTTGALDVAGSFSSRGYDALVALSMIVVVDQASCAVFDLNNRYEDQQVHQRDFTKALHTIFEKYNANNIFLKVDSTLRGYVQSDIYTLLEVFKTRPIFFAPAFPHSGRLCINGQYIVEGKPITETVFAQDHSFRLNSSDLKESFPTAIHIEINTIERGPQAIIDAVFRSGNRLITFDTTSQADLESIAIAASFSHAICVGSSGLARAFPLNNGPFQNKYDHFNDEVPGLFVIGSAHPKSRQQRNALRDLGLHEITLEKKDLQDNQRLQLISEKIRENLHQGWTSMLVSPDNFENDLSYMNDIDEAMSTVTAFSDPIHNLVLVGGETARRVLIARALYALHICGEFEPGIPISQPGNENPWHILTKAGGFGSQYVLNLIFRSIYGKAR